MRLVIVRLHDERFDRMEIFSEMLDKSDDRKPLVVGWNLLLEKGWIPDRFFAIALLPQNHRGFVSCVRLVAGSKDVLDHAMKDERMSQWFDPIKRMV